LTFVFDEDIPPGVVDALKAGGQAALHVTEVCPRGTADQEVFRTLGTVGWYLVTADLAIARRPQQRAALVDEGIGAFFFTGRANRNPFEWIQIVVRRWPAILAYAASHDRPFLCAVPDRGVLARLRID
jgi:hypothetical protein